MSDHYTDGRHWDDKVQGWALDDDPYEDALLSREDLKARIAELNADKKAARFDAAYQEERAEQADAALAAYQVEADAYAQTAAAELVRLYADRTERDRMLRLAMGDAETQFRKRRQAEVALENMTQQRNAAIVKSARARIAELEGENERLRRVIGAAVEDSANLEAERDRAHDDAGNLEGEVNSLKAERDKWEWVARDACRELAYETHVNPQSPLDYRLAHYQRGTT